jgi:N-acetylglucosaminyl-diphospho-decaprenol L-rhamnosyltransferase
MDLSIIIVNWNSLEYLRKCIVSISKHTECSLEIIVVDNASPKGDAPHIAREFPDCKLVACQENKGFGAANNLGFAYSMGECVLFLNPDTELLDIRLDVVLRSVAEIRDGGVFGCTLLNEDLSVQTSCIQAFPTILNLLLDAEWLRQRWPKSRLWGIAPLTSESDLPAKVEAISGACMFVNREVFMSVGGFTEDYFMYAEDIDLCYKIQRAGFSNYFLKGATVLHYGGKSSDPERGTRMKWQAITKFFEKHHGRVHAFFFRCAIVCAALIRIILMTGAKIIKSVSPAAQPSPKGLIKWKIILKTMLAI